MMNLSETHNIYCGRRDLFYCVEIADKSVIRDNQLSELLGEKVTKVYHSPFGATELIYSAKFWKDKDSVIRFINYKPMGNYHLVEMNREEFIDSIPDQTIDENLELRNFHKETYLKNLKLKKQELEYHSVWKEYRKQYKCIDAYKKVKNAHYWLTCKDCGLIPLVWEFNNGRSTGCGCGENEYQHHSIHAESIMSYVKRNGGSALGYNSDELRMNWNQWVKTGQDIFKKQKQNNPDIW